MRNIALAIMGLAGLTVTASAAAPAPSKAPPPSPVAGPCYDVVPNAGQGAPADAILVNRCSGETWVLVRSPMPDDEQSYTYIWEPLSMGKDQPILQMSGPRNRDD